MIPIHQTTAHQSLGVFDTEASSSIQPPEQANIPLIRYHLGNTIQELDALKTLEENTKQFMQEIKQQTNRIEKEIKESKQEKEKIGIEIEKSKNLIDQTLNSHNNQEQEKHLTSLDKINKKIYKAQNSINQLRTTKTALRKEKETQEEILETKTTRNQTIESQIKEEKHTKKSTETEQTNLYKQGSYISSLGDVRELLIAQLQPLLHKVSQSVQHINDKTTINKLISDFTMSTVDTVMDDFSNKLRSNRRDSEQEIKENIQFQYNTLIGNLRTACNGRIGLPLSRAMINAFHATTIIACTGLYIFLAARHGIRQTHNSSNQWPVFEKEIAAFSSVIALLINASIEIYISNKHEKLSTNSLLIVGEKEIKRLSRDFHIQTTLLSIQSPHKKELKKIIETSIGLSHKKFNEWIGEKNTEIHKRIDQSTQEIKNTNNAIEKLEIEKTENNAQLQQIRKKDTELAKRIHETSVNIASLSTQMERNEKLLHQIRDKGKNIASEKSNTLVTHWSTIKQLKNQANACDMTQETLQAKLLSLDLNVQEQETQLSTQQNKVLNQMSKVNTEHIAQHLLIPNMTEHAFKRLIQRHQGIALNQLRQRVEKGRFKNSEGITIDAPAKQASTYDTFYHLLYATLDAIEFIEKSQRIVPNNNYEIQHTIEVGVSHSEQAGPQHKSHSVVSYTPRIDPSTGQQRMVIDHMY